MWRGEQEGSTFYFVKGGLTTVTEAPEVRLSKRAVWKDGLPFFLPVLPEPFSVLSVVIPVSAKGLILT